MFLTLERLLSGSNNTRIRGQKIKTKESDIGQPMKHQQMKQAFITTSVEPRSQEPNLNKDGLIYFSKNNIKACSGGGLLSHGQLLKVHQAINETAVEKP